MYSNRSLRFKQLVESHAETRSLDTFHFVIILSAFDITTEETRESISIISEPYFSLSYSNLSPQEFIDKICTDANSKITLLCNNAHNRNIRLLKSGINICVEYFSIIVPQKRLGKLIEREEWSSLTEIRSVEPEML